jgi:hypothetical protein
MSVSGVHGPKAEYMPGQKKGKKFMVSKRENEVKEKI